jgi:hypothetical protein
MEPGPTKLLAGESAVTPKPTAYEADGSVRVLAAEMCPTLDPPVAVDEDGADGAALPGLLDDDDLEEGELQELLDELAELGPITSSPPAATTAVTAVMPPPLQEAIEDASAAPELRAAKGPDVAAAQGVPAAAGGLTAAAAEGPAPSGLRFATLSCRMEMYVDRDTWSRLPP